MRVGRVRKRVVVLFGTRPEAIKLAPVIVALRKRRGVDVSICVTGQHKEMLEPILDFFGIVPDVNLGLMRSDQTLGGFTARALEAVDAYLRRVRADFVLVQGDTSTVLGGCLAAFYNRVPVGHVEAGLRTWRKYAPFPEEMNRVLASRLADYHYAPTVGAARNLSAEGIPRERIYVTGNPVVDALLAVAERAKKCRPRIPSLPAGVLDRDNRTEIVLITGHRRESFGKGLKNICRALRRLSDAFPEVAFIYPVHLNPNVKRPVYEALGGRRNIFLIDPLPYLGFVALMDRARLILTDSGGVQEEAPSLGKPVLIMRETTERPEGVEAGGARLVGTETDAIVANVTELLSNREAYDAMAKARNPYGDGRAGERIAGAVVEACCGPSLSRRARTD